MAVDDIFRSIATFQHSSGVQANSVFYYRVDIDTGNITSENVNDELISGVLSPMVVGMMPDNWTYVRNRTVNLNDVTDFNESNPGVVGTRQTTGCPPFIAASFRSRQPAVGVHRATHRFPGGTVQDFHDSGLWTGDMQTEMASHCANLGAQLELTDGLITPCVVSINPETQAVTFRAYVHGQWQYSTSPTTQVTRKIPGSWWQAGDPPV